MRQWRAILLALVLLAVLAQPVVTRGCGGDRVTVGRDATLTEGQHVPGDLVAVTRYGTVSYLATPP